VNITNISRCHKNQQMRNNRAVLSVALSSRQQRHDFTLVFRRRRRRAGAQKTDRAAYLIEIVPAGLTQPQMTPCREPGRQWQRAVQIRRREFGEITALQHGVLFWFGRKSCSWGILAARGRRVISSPP